MTDHAKEVSPFDLAFLEQSTTCDDSETPLCSTCSYPDPSPNSLTRCLCHKPFASIQSEAITESRYNASSTSPNSDSKVYVSAMKHASHYHDPDQHVKFCAPLVTAELARYDSKHPKPLKEHHKHRYHHGEREARKVSPPPRSQAKESTSPEDVMMAAWLSSRKC